MILPLFLFLMAQSRHAFLIIAHHHWEQLKKLITLLDHPRVDFYLHIDRKAKFPDPDPIAPCVKRGRLFRIPSLSVNWGGCSQIRCELELIRNALPEQYAYYHLLSGVDMPLKPVEEILSFFDENQGKEFVHFDAPTLHPETFSRFRVYYPLQEWAKTHPFLDWVQWKLVAVQNRLGIDRLKGVREPFAKGANWFSCTHGFLENLMKEEKNILRQYRHSRCCDEIFLQSHLIRTPFVHSLYDDSFSDSCRSNMRLIDWKRGEPYTFRDTDVEELLSSPCLFARKFDDGKDPKVIQTLYETLLNS